MNVLFFVCFSGLAAAQNNFSIYATVMNQPTKDIKVNNVLLGTQYQHEFSPKYKLAADVEFNSENVSYAGRNDYDSPLNEFKSLKSALTFSYTRNPTYKYHFKIEPFIANENQLKFSSLSVFSQFTAEINLKKNHIGTIGIAHNSVFGKPALVPIVSYYYRYSDKLNFLVGFPESAVRYSNNVRNTFVLNNEFNGHFYTLDHVSESPAKINSKASFSQITASFRYERNIDTHWFLIFKAGYDFNKKYLLLDDNYNTHFDFDMRDGFNLGLTIKYKH